ncbi:hypothetical protein HDU81_000199 [Chytriomyces hyalinus]|nr:hypothetical protein HDU81_000199 [Chytriomyces hyalinus]
MTATSSHSPELCSFKLSVATMQQYPNWLYEISSVLSNKGIIHKITPSMSQVGNLNALTLVLATAQDAILQTFTTHTQNDETSYYGYTNNVNTFPGLQHQQYNANHLICLNIAPSLASTIPRTCFAYDTIKHLQGMYALHTANPNTIDTKVQKWLNVQMTGDQSIHSYWLIVATQLADLKNLRTNNPQVELYTQFPQFKHHVINQLHDSFSSIKDNLLKDTTITNKSQLLTALISQSQLINWVPSTVALTTSSSSTGDAFSATGGGKKPSD